MENIVEFVFSNFFEFTKNLHQNIFVTVTHEQMIFQITDFFSTNN